MLHWCRSLRAVKQKQVEAEMAERAAARRKYQLKEMIQSGQAMQGEHLHLQQQQRQPQIQSGEHMAAQFVARLGWVGVFYRRRRRKNYTKLGSAYN